MKKSGDRVGRYLVEAPIGAGGMGEVYEARDTRLGRRVALKLLRSDAHGTANQRLLREAQAAAAFEHPNAVVVYDAGEERGEMYIAMELVRGRPLRAFIGDPSIALAERLRWLIDTARALGAAHRAGLIHRDIKPDNIVVRDDGVIKVLDFGIARRQPSPDAGRAETAELEQMATLTAEGAIVGTPSYWSPEQLRGEEIDARADQFAWAVTAYEVLAGAPPWTAPDALALLSRILTAPPPPLRERAPGVPIEVEQVVLRALSKQPDARYPTLDEAADALELFVGGPASRPREAAPSALASEVRATTSPQHRTALDSGMTSESSVTGGSSSSPPRRARRWPLVAAVLGVVGVAAGVAVALRPGPQPAAEAEAPRPLMVRTLHCRPATLQGRAANPELARAVGVGACARLAVDLGAAWVPPDHPFPAPAGAPQDGAHTLDVVAHLGEEDAEITLKLGDRTSAAKGATPIDALVAAAASLSRRLAPAPMTPQEVAAWGARDADGARRIERVWRRMLLDLAPDDQAAARELLASDPDSAWTHSIAVDAGLGGREGIEAAVKRATELSDHLPRGRALLVRAMLGMQHWNKVENARKEALQLARQAYAEAPDDPYIAALTARLVYQMSGEEGAAMLDRLYERFPGESVFPMKVALQQGGTVEDPALAGKLIQRIRAAFPESIAWEVSIRHRIETGDMDGARRAVEMGEQLGVTGGRSSGNFYAESGRILLELATLHPREARVSATRMLGIPRNMFTWFGARALIASYVVEGRFDDAESMRLGEMERHRSSGETENMMQYALADLRERRLLGRPPPGAERMAWMEDAVDKLPGPIRHFAARQALALARPGGPDKRALAQALKELDALVKDKSDVPRSERDSMLVRSMPGVRALRGDAAAVRLWKETEKAPSLVRQPYALDAALALEATGDLRAAEQAYQLAMDPLWIVELPLQAMAGRIKLAELYRAQKRNDEAAALDAEVDRVWTNADPGVREALRSLR